MLFVIFCYFYIVMMSDGQSSKLEVNVFGKAMFAMSTSTSSSPIYVAFRAPGS